MLFAPPSMLFTTHQGQNNPATPSPRIWERATGASVATEGNNAGTWAGDDFANFGGFTPAISGTTTLPSATVPGPAGYGVYCDTTTTTSTITPLASDVFDYTSIQLLAGATAQHQCTIGGLQRLIPEYRLK